MPTARLIEDLAEHRERCIGLGTANGRFFTFNAGLGLDAEVVRAVEGRRALGRALTPALFTRMALRQYYRITDRRRPAITISRARGAKRGGRIQLHRVELGAVDLSRSPGGQYQSGRRL